MTISLNQTKQALHDLFFAALSETDMALALSQPLIDDFVQTLERELASEIERIIKEK